jgi:hypothetical protein
MSEQFHRIEDISFPHKVYGFGGYTNFSVSENNYSPKSVVSKKVYYTDELVGVHMVTTKKLKTSSYRDASGKVHCFLDEDEDVVSYPVIPFTDNSTLCEVGTEVSCGALWGGSDDCCPCCTGSKSYGTNGWAPEMDLYLWNAEPNVEYELIAQWGCYEQGYRKVDGICGSYSNFIGEGRYKVVFKIPQNLFKETRRVETFSFPYGFKDTVKYYSPNVVRLKIGEARQWTADKHSLPMIKVGYKGTLKYTEDWDWGDGPGY